MEPLSVAALREIVASGDFGALVEHEEGDHLEAKRSNPYDLDSPADRYELAKDVTSLANGLGGYLLIGVETAPHPARPTDVVQRITPYAESDFPAERLRSVLRDNTLPPIAGLTIGWKEALGHPGLGIGVVEVPEQDADKKPFITTRVVEDNQTLKQILVGIAVRKGPNSTPLTPGQVHQMLQRGSNTVSQRLTRIEDKIDLLLDQPRPEAAPDAQEQLLPDRIAALLEDE